MSKPNKLCAGCKSSIEVGSLFYDNVLKCECFLTPEGVKRIPRCPCTHCLIKCMCNKTCDKLVSHFNDFLVNGKDLRFLKLEIGEDK